MLGRRRDGYHELESLFLPLDLADDVELSVGAARRSRVDLSLEGGVQAVPGGSDNLAVQAAERFLAESGVERAVSLRLRKHVPAGAGMGGKVPARKRTSTKGKRKQARKARRKNRRR